MAWTCPRCAAANPGDERTCHHCNARLPFAPPTEVAEPEEAVTIPRRGEITAHLRAGLEEHRAGALATDVLAGRLIKASAAVPQVFTDLCEQLATDEEGYLESVRARLGDCQALFESGLAQMLDGLSNGEDFPVRFGWLLVEKGEDEYLRLLETLVSDS